jgi:uncharacterized protein
MTKNQVGTAALGCPVEQRSRVALTAGPRSFAPPDSRGGCPHVVLANFQFIDQPTSVIIGVISDTHGSLRPEALGALCGSDYIIHAGDIGDPGVLGKLAKVAPVTAIRGNVDREAWARKIPATNVLEVGGVSIYVLHNLQELDLKPEAAGFAVVVYGHSHVAKQEIKNRVLYFNPGSAGPRRFRLPVTIGRLKMKDDEVSAEIVEICAGER